MVRALLDGRKTQTRRLLKLPTKTHSGGPIYEHPAMGGWEPTTNGGDGCFTIGKNGERLPVPETIGIWHRTTGTCMDARYQPGDRLWVREAWCTAPAYDDLSPSEMGGEEPLRYSADDATFNWAEADGVKSGRRRTSMHMPRWASRLTLIVTDVRVQRLQEISRDDAIAEGLLFKAYDVESGDDMETVDGWSSDRFHAFKHGVGETAVDGYRTLWNSLHDKPGERWDDNPWIVALTFSVDHRNIDSAAA